MSSFYDDASLVMIPSGYKNAKIYCEKPTDGSGDLTFTRASSATRVASNGLIEKVRTNLLTYSEQFDNAAYNKGTGGSISANTVIAPDGTTTADAYTWATSTSNYAYLSQSVAATSQIPNTFSIYIKRPAGSGSRTLRLTVSDVTTSTAFSSTFTVTEFWQRFEFSRTSAATTGNVGVGLMTGSTGVSIASGEVLHVWGAQLETGDIATQYIATTTAAVSVGPVSGLPRLDYLNSSCPRLILEPQRTNVITFSEQFDNAAWSKTLSSVTANTTLSPDGYQNADTFTPTSASASSSVSATISSSAATHTMSVYAKVASGTKSFRFFRFNGTDGSVTSPTFTATTTWQIFTWTTTPSVATSTWYIANAAADLVPFIIYGAQLEVGAYATSYIPTLSTSVTRVKDAASKTGISSLIGQTEGTIFAEIYPEEFVNGSYIGISDGVTIANRIIFGFEGGSANSGTIQVYGASGLSSGGTYTRGQRMKVAIAYKSGSSALYVNGNLISSSTSTFTATFTKFGFDSYAGSQGFVGKCSQVLIFKTRLTNAQLAELTTL